MLRALVALLLLANLGFLAWTRGWLGPTPRHGEREPQRIAAQVNPGSLTVLAPTAASAALRAARDAAAVCLQAGPLPEGDLPAAEALLVAARLPEGSWAREPAPVPPPWVVFAGRWPDTAARGARVEELRKARLDAEPIDAPAELAPGLVVSRHADREGAEAALAALRAPAASQPVRGLSVRQLPPSPPRWWLRVAKADADTQARLAAAPVAEGFKPCAAPR